MSYKNFIIVFTIHTAVKSPSSDSVGAKVPLLALTFGGQVGSEQVSIGGGVAASLHARGRQVPRVRVRLVDV